jgi:hypothetical protein
VLGAPSGAVVGRDEGVFVEITNQVDPRWRRGEDEDKDEGDRGEHTVLSEGSEKKEEVAMKDVVTMKKSLKDGVVQYVKTKVTHLLKESSWWTMSCCRD